MDERARQRERRNAILRARIAAEREWRREVNRTFRRAMMANRRPRRRPRVRIEQRLGQPWARWLRVLARMEHTTPRGWLRRHVKIAIQIANGTRKA